MKKLILPSVISALLASNNLYANDEFVVIVNEKSNEYDIYDYTISESLATLLSRNITESNVDFDFLLPLSNGSSINDRATVDFLIEHISTSDNDLTLESGTHHFKNGTELPINIKGDVTSESTQSFRVTLSNPYLIAIDNNTASFSIQDDDALPVVSIENISTINEGQNPVVTLTLSSVSEQNISIDYNTAHGSANEQDYISNSGTIVIPAGQTSATIQLTTNDDTKDEETETFSLNIGNTVNANIVETSKNITINDNDAAPSISITDASISETDDNSTLLTFNLVLSTESEKTVSVDFSTNNGTATAGDDFIAINDNAITFAPLETTKQVSVVVNGDYTFEDHETFEAVLSNASNATISDGSAIGTISNNDVIYEFNTLPLYGIVEYNDGSGWKQVTENTEYSRIYNFRYNPTESEVRKVSRDINVGSFDTDLSTPYYADGNHSISDWGNVSGNRAIFVENGVTVTTTLNQGNLAFANSPGTATGVGLGTSLVSSHELKFGYDLEISLEGDFLNDVKITADGLGGCYDLGESCETKVQIKAYDFSNNLIDTQGGYRQATSSTHGEAYIDDYYFTGQTAIKRFIVGVVPTNVGGNNPTLNSGANPILNMTISRSAFEVMDYKKIDIDGNEVTETLKLNINEGNANVNVDLNSKLEQ